MKTLNNLTAFGLLPKNETTHSSGETTGRVLGTVNNKTIYYEQERDIAAESLNKNTPCVYVMVALIDCLTLDGAIITVPHIYIGRQGTTLAPRLTPHHNIWKRFRTSRNNGELKGEPYIFRFNLEHFKDLENMIETWLIESVWYHKGIVLLNRQQNRGLLHHIWNNIKKNNKEAERVKAAVAVGDLIAQKLEEFLPAESDTLPAFTKTYAPAHRIKMKATYVDIRTAADLRKTLARILPLKNKEAMTKLIAAMPSTLHPPLVWTTKENPPFVSYQSQINTGNTGYQYAGDPRATEGIYVRTHGDYTQLRSRLKAIIKGARDIGIMKNPARQGDTEFTISGISVIHTYEGIGREVFIVRKGTKPKIGGEENTLLRAHTERREKLLIDGFGKLKEDIRFTSPSQAASVITGYQRNGREDLRLAQAPDVTYNMWDTELIILNTRPKIKATSKSTATTGSVRTVLVES